MRKITGILFVILIGALFIEILVGFPVHLEKEPEFGSESDTKKEESAPTQAEQRMEGVHLVESREGNRDWELFAEAAEGYQGKGTWELKNVKVLFYKTEVVEFTVTGKTGNIDTKTRDLRIAGDVTTQSTNGYKFQTEAVSYSAVTRIILSPQKVRMTGPPDARGKGLILNGGSMETRVDDSLMLIKDKVAASKQLNNGKKFVIRSGSAEFSGRSKLARFLEKVSIEVDSLKMEGPEASFEYKDGADLLQSVLVQGGVKVSDMDKFATSESVRFDPEENKFIFRGKPRVVQNNDEITGDQIIFIDGGKKVKVENIKAKVEKK